MTATSDTIFVGYDETSMSTFGLENAGVRSFAIADPATTSQWHADNVGSVNAQSGIAIANGWIYTTLPASGSSVLNRITCSQISAPGVMTANCVDLGINSTGLSPTDIVFNGSTAYVSGNSNDTTYGVRSYSVSGSALTSGATYALTVEPLRLFFNSGKIYIANRKTVSTVTPGATPVIEESIATVGGDGIVQITVMSGTIYTANDEDLSGDFGSVSRIAPAAVPTLSPTTQSTSGTVGQSLTTEALTPTGLAQPITCTVDPVLPRGLTLDSATGVISGSPTEVLAATDYTITCSDQANNSATATVSLAVAANSAEHDSRGQNAELAATGANIASPIGTALLMSLFGAACLAIRHHMHRKV